MNPEWIKGRGAILAASILVHLVLFTWVGSMIIFKGDKNLSYFIHYEPAPEVEPPPPLISEKDEGGRSSEELQEESLPELPPEPVLGGSLPLIASPEAASASTLLTPDLHVSQGILGHSGIGLGQGFGDGEGNGIEKKLFGLTIRGKSLLAPRLGILLDISGSMKPFLPTVLKTIREKFDDIAVVSVKGCRLKSFDRDRFDRLAPQIKLSPPSSQNFYMEIPPSFSSDVSTNFLSKKVKLEPGKLSLDASGIDVGEGQFKDSASAIALLAATGRFDAIYWFSDFADQTGRFEQERPLAEWLVSNHIKLYLHSIRNEPHETLTAIVRATGGQVTITPDPAQSLDGKLIELGNP